MVSGASQAQQEETSGMEETELVVTCLGAEMVVAQGNCPICMVSTMIQSTAGDLQISGIPLVRV